MKNDKFCFSKTLTYLVLMVAVVIGAFYTMNAVNTQKLGANPEAAGACRKNGVKGTYTKNSCAQLAEAMKTPFEEYVAGDYTVNGDTKSRCCIPQKVADVFTGAETKETCKRKKNIIASTLNNGCTYYTGNVSGKGMCKVAVSNDSISCSAGAGKPILDRNTALERFCGTIKGSIKPGSYSIANDGKSRKCLVYSGNYWTTGNRGDKINYCMAEQKVDLITNRIGLRNTSFFATENCSLQAAE